MIIISFKASKAKEQEVKRRTFSLNKEEYIISTNKVPLQKKNKKKIITTKEILNAKF